jgi:hypothetical protein
MRQSENLLTHPKVLKYENLKYKMGLFGSDIQTVSVNQGANGKTTADVKVQIPLWEMVFIMIIVAILVNVCCACARNYARKHMNSVVDRQLHRQSVSNIENI